MVTPHSGDTNRVSFPKRLKFMGNMKRILIVEDDKKIVTALSFRLKTAGYEVSSAPNGTEGTKLAIKEKPNLILMDVWLPRGTGFDVAKRLNMVGLANVPVIFITASRKKGLWTMAQESGAAGFFEKPYDPEALLEAIAQTMQRAA
ncbi:MAG: czcR 2 [Verrucomicrobiales bacterium]|nr:czcR 2 [Verrucomicrobiales bacterium]